MDAGRNAFELPAPRDESSTANHFPTSSSSSGNHVSNYPNSWNHSLSSLVVSDALDSPSSFERLPSTPASSIYSSSPSTTPSPDTPKSSYPSAISLTLPRSFRLLSRWAKEGIANKSANGVLVWDRTEDPFIMEDTAPPGRLHPYDFKRVMHDISKLGGRHHEHVPHVSGFWSPNRKLRSASARSRTQDLTRASRQPKAVLELLERDTEAQSRLAWWLMVGVCGGQELSPFQVSKQTSERPLLNFIVALSGQAISVQQSLIAQSRIHLYSQNKFSFSGPSSFVRFLKCIGFGNLNLLNFKDNVRVSDSFFDLDSTHRLQQLWVHCRVGELLLALKDSHGRHETTSSTLAKSAYSLNIPHSDRSTPPIGKENPKSILWEAILVMHDILDGISGMEDTLVAKDELRGKYIIVPDKPKGRSKEGMKMPDIRHRSSIDIPKVECARISCHSAAQLSHICPSTAQTISDAHADSLHDWFSSVGNNENKVIPVDNHQGTNVPEDATRTTQEKPSIIRIKWDVIECRPQDLPGRCCASGTKITVAKTSCFPLHCTKIERTKVARKCLGTRKKTSDCLRPCR